MESQVQVLKIIVGRKGGSWALMQGTRALGAFSAMEDAMAAVRLFSRQIEAAGRQCELVIEEEPAVPEISPGHLPLAIDDAV